MTNNFCILEGYFRRDPDKIQHFAKIPVQPISYEGAYGFLRFVIKVLSLHCAKNEVFHQGFLQ